MSARESSRQWRAPGSDLPVAGWHPNAGSGVPTPRLPLYPVRDLPAAGWYPDPDGSGLMRWWDGWAWTTRMLEPWSPPRSPAGRLAWWLASPAGSLLSAIIAAVAIVGWAATAVIFAFDVVTGRPMAGVTPTLNLATLAALPILDVPALVVAQMSRAGQGGPVRSVGATRDMRRAARRAGRARRAGIARPSTARTLASRTFRRVVRRLDGSSWATSLPRPVGRILAAVTWLTVLAFAWSVARDGLQFWDASGQQFAVMTVMMHMDGWCVVACRRLNRNRSSARLWIEHPAQRTAHRH